MIQEIEIVDIAKIKIIKFSELKVGDLILYGHFRSRVVEIGTYKVKIEQFAFEKESLMSIDRWMTYYKILEITTKKVPIN